MHSSLKFAGSNSASRHPCALRPSRQVSTPPKPITLATTSLTVRPASSFDWRQCRSATNADASSNEASTSSTPPPPTDHRQRIQGLVEVSMLAAFSGLAYTLFTTVGLDRYVGYFLPMPVIIASVRNGVWAGVRTVSATSVLLVALQGPFKALIYFFMHGLVSFTLGAMWAKKAPWALSVPLAAAARVVGTIGYIGVSSFVLNENLYLLLLNNVLLVLDNIAATVGAAAAPPLPFVVAVIAVVMMINALVYTLLSHILYTLLLSQMEISPGKMPKFAERLIYGSSGAQQSA